MFKKFILFFILLIIFLSLSAFFVNVFNLQNNYFSSKNNNNSTVAPTESENSEEVVTPSSYSIFTKELFDNALSNNRVVVLFFNANWCKECIDQSAINTNVFNDLLINGVIGLESHILDSETTLESESLAKKFDVIKENTLVILDKKGAVVFRHVGNFDYDALMTKIKEVGEIQ